MSNFFLHTLIFPHFRSASAFAKHFWIKLTKNPRFLILNFLCKGFQSQCGIWSFGTKCRCLNSLMSGQGFCRPFPSWKCFCGQGWGVLQTMSKLKIFCGQGGWKCSVGRGGSVDNVCPYCNRTTIQLQTNTSAAGRKMRGCWSICRFDAFTSQHAHSPRRQRRTRASAPRPQPPSQRRVPMQSQRCRGAVWGRPLVGTKHEGSLLLGLQLCSRVLHNKHLGKSSLITDRHIFESHASTKRKSFFFTRVYKHSSWTFHFSLNTTRDHWSWSISGHNNTFPRGQKSPVFQVNFKLDPWQKTSNTEPCNCTEKCPRIGPGSNLFPESCTRREKASWKLFEGSARRDVEW